MFGHFYTNTLFYYTLLAQHNIGSTIKRLQQSNYIDQASNTGRLLLLSQHPIDRQKENIFFPTVCEKTGMEKKEMGHVAAGG